MKKGKENDKDRNESKPRSNTTDTDGSSNQEDENNIELQESNDQTRRIRLRRRIHSDDDVNAQDRRTNNNTTTTNGTNTDQSFTRKTKSNQTKLVDENDHGCGKIRSISQWDESISTASITNISSASTFGLTSGGAWSPHRRRRTPKPPSRNLYNAQLQLLLTMTGGSVIAFLFFFLNIFAFASFMMGLVSVIMLLHTIYINIGSIAGIISQEAPTHAYDVSKAAVHHLTKKMAADLAKKNITVNAIAPGYVPSRMSKGLSA